MSKQQERDIDVLTRRLADMHRERDAALLKNMTLEAEKSELAEIVNPMGARLHNYRAQLDAIRALIDYPEEPIDVVLVDKIRAILNPETPHD